MERKVNTDDLKPGMYVSRLDRPWIETPFMFQGFYVQDFKDVQELQRHCHFVYIDIERGEPAPRYLQAEQPQSLHSTLCALCGDGKPGQRYPDDVSFEEELATAKETHGRAQELVNNIMDDVRAGRKLNAAGIREAAAGMISSIVRNPDAFLWLARLKQADTYTYSHAIAACTLAVAFGRHLALPKAELSHVAVGTLLFDIGKMKLAPELLQHPGPLTTAQFELVKSHVAHSVTLMESTPGVSREATEVALHHHERHNGNGYPQGLANGAISVYGRMAALVDCYDAITSDRAYARALSPYDAIHKLYQWRGVDFQEDLVEQFIQCLGVFPVGTLVELSSGQIGIVLAQNRVRRLRPKVMLVLDQNKQPYGIAPTIDLMHDPEYGSDQPLSIVRPLEPGSYGIDPQQYYI
ncbi:MAG TPA: HD-GYP domain-containing protein [Gammaproteobacteria bacterium]|nr:HD-GYP domain-containing protein [Gammaproteobacteria bacterium]